LINKNPTCFQTIQLWGQLAAASYRGNIFCIEEHRRALILSGEPEKRVDKIRFWTLPNLFTKAERAAIAFSEAISNRAYTNQLEDALEDVGQYFEPMEVQELSSSVLAVNQWIDLHESKPVRVIVVEDNKDDQELLNRELRKTEIGDHVLFLSNPKSVLQLLNGPDEAEVKKSLLAFVFDINLPEMTGIELLRKIRSMESWEHFPVIMMSTDSRPDYISACTELNVMAFIEKPLTVSSFAGAIAPLFHQSVAH
jgi:CheY-like chemotaxis protein